MTGFSWFAKGSISSPSPTLQTTKTLRWRLSTAIALLRAAAPLLHPEEISRLPSNRPRETGCVYGSQLIELARRRYLGIDSKLMKIRRSRGFAGVVIVTMAVAWFFAANHCALAAVESLKNTEHACCHSDQGTTEPFPTQCCKALAAPVPQATVAPAVHLDEFQPAWIEASRVQVAAEISMVVAFATGPPRRSTSFAVLVLNRSLLAHAPPVQVA